MTAQAIALDDTDVSFQYAPERRLWAEALRLLIDDARRYWLSKRPYPYHLSDTTTEQAFDDLIRCGPMLRHCCKWLDVEPETVSRAFMRWCEGH